MSARSPSVRQRGAVMIVALIVLMIISVVVVRAFVLTSSNLRSVGNVQFRAEAIASANRALEQVVSGSFLAALNSTTSSNVDLNKDGVTDYTVTVAIPQCPIRVARVAQDAPSGYETGGGGTAAGTYVVDWELKATVADATTGASAVIHHGVRLPMAETDYDTYVVPCGLTLYPSP
jgi:Tfp pilus assembly protein PilX